MPDGKQMRTACLCRSGAFHIIASLRCAHRIFWQIISFFADFLLSYATRRMRRHFLHVTSSSSYFPPYDAEDFATFAFTVRDVERSSANGTISSAYISAADAAISPPLPISLSRLISMRAHSSFFFFHFFMRHFLFPSPQTPGINMP